MEIALFEKIKFSHYANFISFAIWDDNDINNLLTIDENIENLNQNIVIVGLNVSRGVNKFQNFHVKHRGGRDSWLKDAFNNGCFRGAYMTDIIKNDVSPRQSLVDLSMGNIIKNIKEFKKELNFINCRNPYIVAIGYETTRILQQFLPEYAENIHAIPHYAKRGITKKEFVESIKKLGK